MKKVTFILILLCMLIFSSCTQKKNVQDSGEVAKQLSQVWKDYTEAWKSEDIDKVMSYHADGFINYPFYGVTQTGLDETRAFIKNIFDNNTIEEMKITQNDVVVEGNLAYEAALLEQNLTTKEGQKNELRARSISIFRKQADGSWKFYRWIGQP